MTTCYDCADTPYYCAECYYADLYSYYEERVEQPEEVALADIFILEGSDWEPAFPIETIA